MPDQPAGEQQEGKRRRMLKSIKDCDKVQSSPLQEREVFPKDKDVVCTPKGGAFRVVRQEQLQR